MTGRAAPPRLLAVSHTGLQSGAERVLSRLLARAEHEGWAVTCCLPAGPFAETLRGQGVTTVPIPNLKLPVGPRPLAGLLLLLRTLRAALVLRRAARDVDVVVVNGLLGLPSVRLARVRPPVLWLVHDIVHKDSWVRLLQVVRGAVAQAIAVSEAAAAPLRALRIPVRVVRNGTAWPVAAAPPARDPLVVGCLGLLTPWKGQDVLLEAVAGMPGLVVELAGGSFPKDAPYVERLRARAARPDLAGRAHLLGPLDDVHARLRSWAVAVCPSVDPEPASLAVLEAMSVGVPVIASDHGGPAEYIGGSGILVPPGDVEALRAALRLLLTDPGRRARCGQEGRRLVETSFQVEDRIGELLHVVAAALGPGPRTGPVVAPS